MNTLILILTLCGAPQSILVIEDSTATEIPARQMVRPELRQIVKSYLDNGAKWLEIDLTKRSGGYCA